MYAIIETGGKQYKVEKDLIVKIEKLENADGDKIKFPILLLSDENKLTVGNPTVEGAYVEGEILYSARGKKINIFKYKSKKNERKRQGHRQPFTAVKVLDIVK